MTRLKDGRTRLGPIIMRRSGSRAILAAAVRPGDAGDTLTLKVSLAARSRALKTLDLAPAPRLRAEIVTDTGYHSRELLQRLHDQAWQSRISEPTRQPVLM
jgi:hypothetical protein